MISIDINTLRHFSRKLIRELGILHLNKELANKHPSHSHALIEISKEQDITISQLANLLLLSTSAASRIVTQLVKDQLVTFKQSADKREKYLDLTAKGHAEVSAIDEFSNTKIIGACEFLTSDEQKQIIQAIKKYGEALEKNRVQREQIKIATLSTSRTIRKQIIELIANIQQHEFGLVLPDNINAGIIKAEEEYYYNNASNFWYAVDKNGKVIGSIGLKKIDAKSGEIKKFFVDQKFRGKNVAAKLMQTLIKNANKHNFKFLHLGTVDIFQAAHRFYEKNGFSRITKQQLPKNFSFCTVDTIFFQKVLT